MGRPVGASAHQKSHLGHRPVPPVLHAALGEIPEPGNLSEHVFPSSVIIVPGEELLAGFMEAPPSSNLLIEVAGCQSVSVKTDLNPVEDFVHDPGWADPQKWNSTSFDVM